MVIKDMYCCYREPDPIHVKQLTTAVTLAPGDLTTSVTLAPGDLTTSGFRRYLHSHIYSPAQTHKCLVIKNKTLRRVCMSLCVLG